MQLEEKVVVITGAGSGMGKAMAELFAREGAWIVAADWNQARLEEVVSQISAGGNPITGVQGNIGDRATADAVIDAALSAYDRLDVLINNAGIMDFMQPVGEVPDDVWRKVLSVNLDGPMFTSRRAIPHMLERKRGSIINIASTAGLSGGAAGAAYTVSKHGLIGLTRNTAWQYATQGIRCNAICPGATKTNIGETMPQERLSPFGAQRAGAFASLIPAYLDPIDIAHLARFLASDESRYVNGAVIPADGGWMAL
jgi:NAD(P)-dependent dehydrogenase (short-subunit alcohol dehydrogenase family)